MATTTDWKSEAKLIANDRAIDHPRNVGTLGAEPWRERGHSVIWGKRSEDRDTEAEIAAARALLANKGIEELGSADSDDGRVWAILVRTHDYHNLMPDPVFIDDPAT